ncbi:50S ribosomal protein L22 [Patescibacteria group bacterium]|nr:50S ribosomal protein L22 [Patescibacteria group bacterium]
MKAILRQVRLSPKKANLVAGIIRGKKVEEALNLLKFTPKKGAKILYKVIASATANAENNFKQDKKNLSITEIVVNEGPTYKRSMPCSRGRVHPILKRTSHITVNVGILEEKEDKKSSKKAKGTKEIKEVKKIEEVEEDKAEESKEETPSKE